MEYGYVVAKIDHVIISDRRATGASRFTRRSSTKFSGGIIGAPRVQHLLDKFEDSTETLKVLKSFFAQVRSHIVNSHLSTLDTYLNLQFTLYRVRQIVPSKRSSQE